jgi:fused signal recognition particle receptor
MSFWKRLKKGLEKTSAGLERALGFSKLDSDSLEALEESLIMTDMGVKTAMTLVTQVQKAKVQTSEEAKEVLAKSLETLLEPVAVPFRVDTAKKPFVILMVGVNGTGKTTTIGKLAMNWEARGTRFARK